MHWHYSRQGVQHGPVSEEELRSLIRSGELSPEDLAWNPNLGNQWVAISFIPSLNDHDQAGDIPPPPGFPTAPLSPDGNTPNRELMSLARASLKGNWGLAVFAMLLFFIVVESPNFLRLLLNPLPYQALIHHQPIAPPHPSAVSLTKSLLSLAISLASILIIGPLMIGISRFSLNLARRTNPALSNLFVGFRRGGSYYWRTVGLQFLITILILGWVLVTLIPALFLDFGATWVSYKHPEFHAFKKAVLLILFIAVFIFLMIKAYSYSMAMYVVADDPSVRAWEAIRRSVRMMKGRIWKLFCLGLRFLGCVLLALLTLGIGFLWVGAYAWTSMAHFYDDVKGRADNPPTGG